MKIALLTKYGELAASTRQRFLQYRPFLSETGFELVHRPLFDDAYLQRLYVGHGRQGRYVAARYIDRLRWLLSSPDVDIIWLHCELFPYLPGLLERLSGWPGKPVVFDFDDAIFHNYDHHLKRPIRRFLGRKLHKTHFTIAAFQAFSPPLGLGVPHHEGFESVTGPSRDVFPPFWHPTG